MAGPGDTPRPNRAEGPRPGKAASPAALAAPSASSQLAVAASPGRAWRILIVEDERDIRTTMTDLLAGLGQVSIDHAESLSAAMPLLERSQYDIVIADERLGDGSGTDLLGWIGTRAPATGLVLMSAFEDFQMLERAVNLARIHTFFAKPLDPAACLTKLEALLQEQDRLEHRIRAFARASAAGPAEEPRIKPDAVRWPPS